MKDEFNRKVNEIEESYLKNEDNKLKLQYIIHDYILSNTTYDYDNYVNGSIPKIAYNAYGVLVKGVAVCEGYSKAAKLLMNLADIESGIIKSPEMNHAWNYVNIDGSYYHMDITWDDSVPEKNRSIYNYFNLSDDEISKDHIWNSDIYPKCTNDKFNFLRINNSDNMARVDEKIYILLILSFASYITLYVLSIVLYLITLFLSIKNNSLSLLIKHLPLILLYSFFILSPYKKGI